MKRHTILRLALAAFCAVGVVGAANAQQAKVLDKIVAVVGNEIITESELEIQLALMSRRNPVDTQDPAVRKEVLEAMIGEKLVLAQAELDSVTVSEERVDGQLDQQIRYMERQYGSRERLEREAGMTVAEMKREYRNDVRKRIMIQDLQAQKFGDIKVTRREVTDFYFRFRDSLPEIPAQIELSQIVRYPRVLSTFKEETRQRAQALLDSIKAGADFGELAKKYSDDAGSARNGGNLGLARRGVFVREFEEAAFSLEPGDVSGVVETSFGFHIIKLIEKKGEAIEAQHILLKVKKTGESDQGAIDTLKSIRERALAGEDFAALSVQYSEDPQTASRGGSLGLVEVSQLEKNVYEAQENLDLGGISEPIKIDLENDYAYAIFKVERRIPPHQPELQEDYARLETFTRNLKQRELYDKWLDEIRGNIYYEIKM